MKQNIKAHKTQKNKWKRNKYKQQTLRHSAKRSQQDKIRTTSIKTLQHSAKWSQQNKIQEKDRTNVKHKNCRWNEETKSEQYKQIKNITYTNVTWR